MRYLLTLPAVLVLLGGCAAPSSAPTAGQTASPAAPAHAAVVKPAAASNFTAVRGMTAEQLRAENGPPDKITPMEAPKGRAEVWHYSRPAGSVVRQVVARMQEVPYTDPLTGLTRMVQEPVYQQERRDLTERIEVLVFEGVVLESKRSVAEARSYQ